MYNLALKKFACVPLVVLAFIVANAFIESSLHFLTKIFLLIVIAVFLVEFISSMVIERRDDYGYIEERR